MSFYVAKKEPQLSRNAPHCVPLIEAILAQHIDQKHVNKAVTLLCSINPDHPVITRQHLVDFEWCKSDTGAEGGLSPLNH